jgi:ABC-type Na+ efflux pump permease subunit
MTSLQNDPNPPVIPAFRLIAFSIVILAGALALGLGSIAERSRDAATGTGGTLVFVGGLLFFGELYLSGFFSDLWRAIMQQRERPTADEPPPPRPTD